MIIANLVKQNLIGKGTWIGIGDKSHPVIYRIVVESITTSGDVIGIDYLTNQKVKVQQHMVVEIDGMNISRFLSQADLDSNGVKIQNLVRRGRKPKKSNNQEIIHVNK